MRCSRLSNGNTSFELAVFGTWVLCYKLVMEIAARELDAGEGVPFERVREKGTEAYANA